METCVFCDSPAAYRVVAELRPASAKGRWQHLEKSACTAHVYRAYRDFLHLQTGPDRAVEVYARPLSPAHIVLSNRRPRR